MPKPNLSSASVDALLQLRDEVEQALIRRVTQLRSELSKLGHRTVNDTINPLGIKGLGEIGIVGVAAAIANAVYHATGKRVRDLPITLDKLRL
jgi:hypothetical protein